MKFEQVLKMYWSKGFFFNGRVITFNHSFKSFCYDVSGLHYPIMSQMLWRFELNQCFRKRYLLFSSQPNLVINALNIIFSQWSSINHSVEELKRFHSLKLYLIKTTRGKAQALGKPCRGQRTWSNAWTAYFTNKVVRSFLNKMQAELNKNKKEEKINFNILKKKQKRPKNVGAVRVKKKKKLLWF